MQDPDPGVGDYSGWSCSARFYGAAEWRVLGREPEEHSVYRRIPQRSPSSCAGGCTNCNPATVALQCRL